MQILRYIHFMYSDQYLKTILFQKNLIKSERPVIIFFYFFLLNAQREQSLLIWILWISVIKDSDMFERDIFVAEK